jgi:hypothetical protein
LELRRQDWWSRRVPPPERSTIELRHQSHHAASQCSSRESNAPRGV